jgi:hypothetical protein
MRRPTAPPAIRRPKAPFTGAHPNGALKRASVAQARTAYVAPDAADPDGSSDVQAGPARLTPKVPPARRKRLLER